MLFQPTNITPDVINGIGNGTVDITQGLTVSWQVNGNSPLYAYEIFIYRNNAASTQVFDSGKQTLGTPFSGVDYQGNVQIFEASTIAYSAGTGLNALTNGNQYKIKIRQWYSSSSSDYIDQRSMSVFYCRAIPSVSIAIEDGTGSSVSTYLTTRDATFTGTYTQTQGDPLAWFQWALYALVNVTGKVQLATSGKIYGSTELKFEYDGFVNHTDYEIQFKIQTANGQERTATSDFSTSWSESDLPATTTVCKLNSQSTAVQLTWSGFRYIDATVISAEVANGYAYMYKDSSSALWNKENGSPLSISTPWMFVMRTKLRKQDANIFNLTGTTASCTYTLSSRQLSITVGSASPITISNVQYDATLTFIITPDTVYVRQDYITGDLVPSASLTPGASLTPNEGDQPAVTKNTYSISYTQSAITSVRVRGIQEVDYVQVISNYSNDTLNDIVDTAYDDNTYNPDTYMADGTRFLASFSDGTFNAGTLSVSGTNITGWAIYRRKETDPVAIHLIDVPVSAWSILDYGCGSGEGMYHYEIYPVGNKRYLTAAIKSRSFNPIYENWSIVEAYPLTDYFAVINEYVFGKNLSSGSVSNNNSPGVFKNFTQYPTVMTDYSNYQSGTLQSYIGQITYFSYVVQLSDTLSNIAARFGTTPEQIIADNDNITDENDLIQGMVIKVLYNNGIGDYYDDKKLRDDIWNLSTTQNTLFLKSRKGDVMKIRISKDISMETIDGSVIQPQNAAVPWVQIGDATNASIIGGIAL